MRIGVEGNPQSAISNHYQLAFRTPGIIPESARSRKQIRQMPNFRRYARERPQRWQRLCCRTPNFGLRFAFSTMALRAIRLPLCLQVTAKRTEYKTLFSLPLSIYHQRLVISTERHPQLSQQRKGLIVTRRAGHERDVHAVHLLDLVVVDLREDHLLLEAE